MLDSEKLFQFGGVMANQDDRIRLLTQEISKLNNLQLDLVSEVVEQLRKDYIKINSPSPADPIFEDVVIILGDFLKIHHCFSNEPFRKDKFEYALDRTCKLCHHKSKLSPPNNQGEDITIDGVRYSLKTEAEKSIIANEIHISKFRELGKGGWTDKVEELVGLRKQFLDHLARYDRILTLRCLTKGNPYWQYELVEIPKDLLQKAEFGTLRIMNESRQLPKPGYCDVNDPIQGLLFQLYFDGGGERKLQLRHLQKSLCQVRAEWIFTIEVASNSQLRLDLS